MTTARRNSRHHDGPTTPDKFENVYLVITSDMASALGPIAGEHPSASITIWHAASVDPDNVWRVRVDDDPIQYREAASYLYLVNDESGTIDPEPTHVYDGHRID